MDTNEKSTLDFRVIATRNPKTGENLLRPVIVNRKTLNMRQLIAYAKEAGYVRGQTRDLEGLLGGFIQAMQARAKAGYSINVNDWFIVSGHLKGAVGEDRQLSAANSYHVTITATKDLKASIKDFSWNRVDGGASIKVESLVSVGGVKNEIVKSRTLTAHGQNLSYHADWDDTVVVSWTQDGDTKSAKLAPSEQSETYLRFDWPTELAEVPSGTELTFTFRLRETKEAAVQTSVRTVRLVDEA